MQGLFKYLCLASGRDAISDCAKSLIDTKKLKMTYPPESESEKALFINLKA